MAASRRLVSVDANVLIAGLLYPRWPFEVLRAVASARYQLVLSRQVVDEAIRHLPRSHLPELQRLLDFAKPELLRQPGPRVAGDPLVRDESDAPLALALLRGRVEIFVTSDRDFTDRSATAPAFHKVVTAMLPAIFLKEMEGWSSDQLEAIRSRRWDELQQSKHSDR